MTANIQEQTLYGSATLLDASAQDISFAFDPEGSTGLPLGHNDNDRNHGCALVLGPGGDPGHALTFGRTRGGKFVSAITPALFAYSGSMVVIDVKGESAWITAERRRAMGQRVVIIDPWDEVNRHFGDKVGILEQTTRFNPLSSLDPRSPDFVDEISAIAEAFILQTGNDPHWPDSARELVAGLIAAEVERNPGHASMGDIRSSITAPIQILQKVVEAVVAADPNSVAAAKLSAFVEKDMDGKPVASREFAGIRSTARTQTAFLDSTRLIDSMESDDPVFNLSELATGRVTLYLVLPVDKLKSHGRWLRMILSLAIMAIAKQTSPPALPVLMMLDELGTISPGSGLSMVEQSFGLMAGLGIRIWAFLQDLPQLKRDYPQSWETFISNSSVIQLLNVADDTTADYFSKYLGNGTLEVNKGWAPHVRPANVGRSGNPNDGRGVLIEALLSANEGANVSSLGGPFAGNSSKGYKEKQVWEAELSYHGRPVMFPWELRNSPADSSILIFPGIANVRLKRFVYYKDPVMAAWARPDPRYARSQTGQQQQGINSTVTTNNTPASPASNGLVQPAPSSIPSTGNSMAMLLGKAWLVAMLLALLFGYAAITHRTMPSIILTIVFAVAAWQLKTRYSR